MRARHRATLERRRARDGAAPAVLGHWLTDPVAPGGAAPGLPAGCTTTGEARVAPSGRAGTGRLLNDLPRPGIWPELPSPWPPRHLLQVGQPWCDGCLPVGDVSCATGWHSAALGARVARHAHRNGWHAPH